MGAARWGRLTDFHPAQAHLTAGGARLARVLSCADAWHASVPAPCPPWASYGHTVAAAMPAPYLTCAPPVCRLFSLLLELAACGALADAAAWLAQPPPVQRTQRRRQGPGRLPQASPDAEAQVGPLALRDWLSGWVGEGAGRETCLGSVHGVHHPSKMQPHGCAGAPLASTHAILCCYPLCAAPPPFLQYDETLSDLGRLVAAMGAAVKAAQQEVVGAEAAAAATSGPPSGANQQQEATVADAAVLGAQAREDCDAARQLLQPQRAALAEQSLTTLGCAHLACGNCAGASEAGFKGRRCDGCHLVRFCGEACRDADWARHRPQCRQLQQRQAPGQYQGAAERHRLAVPAAAGGAGD